MERPRAAALRPKELPPPIDRNGVALRPGLSDTRTRRGNGHV